jgi:thioredoxin 1
MSSSRDHGVIETVHRTEADFDGALASARDLVMVDFWADWCGPCRAIAPVLEALVEAAGGRVTLMKVNVDESRALAARYGIRSIPTLLFFKEGARRRPGRGGGAPGGAPGHRRPPEPDAMTPRRVPLVTERAVQAAPSVPR